MRSSNASRQVVFALLVAFVIMAASGGAWLKRVQSIRDINVAKRQPS